MKKSLKLFTLVFVIALITIATTGCGSKAKNEEAAKEISSIENKVDNLFNEDKTDLQKDIKDKKLEEIKADIKGIKEKDLNEKNKKSLKSLEKSYDKAKSMIDFQKDVMALFKKDIVKEEKMKDVDKLSELLKDFKKEKSFYDRLNKKLDNAEQQIADIQSAKKYVNSLFKNNKVKSNVTIEKKQKAEKLIKEIKDKKQKKLLEGKLEKVNEFIAAKSKKEDKQKVEEKENKIASSKKENNVASNNSNSNEKQNVKNNSSNQQGTTSNNSSNSKQSSTKKPTTSTSNNSSSNNNNNQTNNAKPKPKPNNLPAVAKTNVAQRTNQIVTVVGSGASAKVEYWYKSNGQWKKSFTTNGFVGSQGIGSASEYVSRTPKGAYSLGFAFGTSNPGTKKSFRQITKNSYWISNVNDSDYNTWQERKSSNKADEHLASYPTQYKYGMVINYNTNRTKGAGSAFFLHVSNGRPTAGCVAIPESRMVQLMKALNNNAYIIMVNSESEIANY